MPPRKSATLLVGEYDVEFMTEEELRTYIEALKEEHERMRKFRNIYHKEKNEILAFLKSIQEKNIYKKGIDIQKSIEIQKFIFDSEQNSKHEDVLNRITELESNNKEKLNMQNSFINLKTVQIHNKEKEAALLADIAEKDQQIQLLEHTHSLMLVQLKEKALTKHQELTENCHINFERIVKQYDENFLEALEEFSTDKIEKLHAVWGDSSETKCNQFADKIEDMTAYFKDIYWKNIKTIENLYSNLIDHKKELNTVTLNLRDVTKKTEQLQMKKNKQSSPRRSLLGSPRFSVVKVKTLEELLYENYLLTTKLIMLRNEFIDLKQKFTLAVRNIYQKADFKTLLLEKKLLNVQND